MNSSLEGYQHPIKFGLGWIPHLPQAIFYIFMTDVLTEAVCILEDCTFCEWALAFCWLHRSCDEPFCYHFSCDTHTWCTGTLENVSEKWGKTDPCFNYWFQSKFYGLWFYMTDTTYLNTQFLQLSGTRLPHSTLWMLSCDTMIGF